MRRESGLRVRLLLLLLLRLRLGRWEWVVCGRHALAVVAIVPSVWCRIQSQHRLVRQVRGRKWLDVRAEGTKLGRREIA